MYVETFLQLMPLMAMQNYDSQIKIKNKREKEVQQVITIENLCFGLMLSDDADYSQLLRNDIFGPNGIVVHFIGGSGVSRRKHLLNCANVLPFSFLFDGKWEWKSSSCGFTHNQSERCCVRISKQLHLETHFNRNQMKQYPFSSINITNK